MTEAPQDRSTALGEALVVGLIAVLAMSVRMLALAQWADNPLFSAPVGDEANFHQTALRLLGLAGSEATYLYQPLYSFYLAVAYGVFGPDVGTVKMLQLLIGVDTVLIFYGLGRELAGDRDRTARRWGGRIAALFAALYAPLVFFEGQLLAPVLCVPLVAGSLWCLLAARRLRITWLIPLAGLLLGLAIMGRPNVSVLVPVVCVWLFLVMRGGWKPARRLLAIPVFVAALIAGLLPSMAYNLHHGFGFVPVSASAGHSFYIGNNPQASGAFRIPSGERIDATSHEAYQASLASVAAQAEGRDLTPSEVSSYWLRRGLAFWRDMPGRALALAGRKILLALNSEEQPIHHSMAFARELAPVVGWLLPFGIVFPFSVLGMVLGRRRRGTGLLLGCALGYLATLVAFYVADRYRMLLLPMLVPLAAVGVTEAVHRIRTRPPVGWILPGLLLSVSFAITQLPFSHPQARARALSGGYNLMGTVEAGHGNLAKAEQYFRRAVQEAGPDHGAVPRANLGLILERRGDLDGASKLFREAARIDPEYRFVRVRLAFMAERAGDLTDALRWWEELARLEADPAEALRQVRRVRDMMRGTE